jgi:hypothetical protein
VTGRQTFLKLYIAAFQIHGAHKAGLGLRKTSHPVEDGGAVVVGRAQIGVGAQRAIIGGHCRPEVHLHVATKAEVVVETGQIVRV